jgi:hypothetical protein
MVKGTWNHFKYWSRNFNLPISDKAWWAFLMHALSTVQLFSNNAPENKNEIYSTVSTSQYLALYDKLKTENVNKITFKFTS